MKTHVDRGVRLLEPVGGSLRRILPIVLSHHDKFDGSGYHDAQASRRVKRASCSRPES